MNPRYVLSFLCIFKIPGMLPIMKDWQAFLRMHFIFAAYESGLLAVLAQGPLPKEALVRALDASRPELLQALLDVGLAVKELGVNEQGYFLKGKRAKAAASPKGDVVAAMIQANVSYYNDSYRHTAARIKGAPLGEDLAEIGEVVARFAKGIEPIVRDYIRAIVTGRESMQVMDVGCGSAFFLRSAHEANPQARGVGIEMDPAVAAQARENLVSWGLEERFNIVEGDIRQAPPEAAGPFDLINLSNMLYYFDRAERADLLRGLYQRLAPSGMLSVVMNFASRGKDLAAANLNLVNCSLKGLNPLPDVDQMREELKECGFREIQMHSFLPASTFLGMTALA